MSKAMKQKNGFSLVELLIVIGIIAVLGGVMLTQFSGSTESALATSCLNNMRSLCNAVLAEASKTGYYPSAGPYKFIDTDRTSRNYNQNRWCQGWIGYDLSDQPVSCYHEASGDGVQQYTAITNGSIWRVMKGGRGAYVCPAHTKHCKRGNRPSPAWSYAMNSYFGWDFGNTYAGLTGGRRKFGAGEFTFKYTSKPTERKRSAERVLLFAEIPFVAIDNVQNPDYETGATVLNDGVLQYANDEGGVEKYNRPSDGDSECIAFNHKSGQDYSAHVAFADGHCAKLVLPRDCTRENLVQLTSWLCTGQDYTFNGARYEKVSE